MDAFFKNEKTPPTKYAASIEVFPFNLANIILPERGNEMKKFVFFGIISTSLLLGGCGQNTVVDDLNEVNASAEEVVESTEHETQPTLDEKKKLGIEIETALSAASSTDDVDVDGFGEFMIFDHGTFSIKTVYNENDDMRLTEYTVKGEEMPSIIMISAEKNDYDKFVEFGSEIFLQSPVWGEDYANVYEAKGNNTYVFAYIFNDELNPLSLPLNFNQMKTNDLLENADTRQEIGELIRSHNYSGVVNLAEEYAVEKQPHESDSVHQILALFEPIAIYLDDITVEKDDFDGNETVVYKDLNSINSSNNFFASIKNNSLYYDYGFEKEHWLFFDKTAIKIGDAIYSDSLSKTERDVLGGSLIRETASTSKYVTTSLEEILENAKEENSGTIRFSGSKGDLDLELSNDEIKSLYVITNLKDASDSTMKLLWNFSKDTEED